MSKDSQGPLWEVFVQKKAGQPYVHCGNLHAYDKEMALQNARDLYTRRGEGMSLWVVPSEAIVSSSPEDIGSFFEPSNDKIFRHPTFYQIPDGIGHMYEITNYELRMMEVQEALYKYTLRLGDTSLILAQRLSEWTGHGPFLEEDLALTNIALDIFGRAKSLLEYAAKVEGKGRTEDDLAFFRNDRGYYNALITEQPNGDYAKTVIRQAFIDSFDLLFYSALAKSKDETLAGIAQKSIKEITYHKRHSFSWVMRFGNGTEESQQRLQKGFDEIWQYTGELFEMNEVDKTLIKEGIAVDLDPLKKVWIKEISELLFKANIQMPEDTFMQRGSRDAIHTEYLGFILAEMQALPRMHPEAKW